MSLRLLSYNIRYGGVGREDPIASVVNSCSPDVVVFEEAIRPEVVERVAAKCGMKTWGSMKGHSLGYASRTEIVKAEWHNIPFGRRRYLELTLDEKGTRVFGVHLSAIHSNITERRRMYETTSLLSGITRRQTGFHVITGDFNTLAPGERLDLSSLPMRLRAIVWLTGRNIRWRTIQLMLDHGYIDGYRKLHPDGEAFTFPTWDPHVRLDYIFVPSAYIARLSSSEVMRDAPRAREASDHFPLLSVISEA